MDENSTEVIFTKSGGSLILNEVRRPWGNFQQFTENRKSTIKIISVEPFNSLSLQYHNHRDEFWKVIKGQCNFTVGENVFQANEGDEINIPRKVKHRIRTASVQVWVLEISFGHFDEADINRLEDDYERTLKSV